MIQLQKLNVNWALTCWSTLECSRDKLLLVPNKVVSQPVMITWFGHVNQGETHLPELLVWLQISWDKPDPSEQPVYYNKSLSILVVNFYMFLLASYPILHPINPFSNQHFCGLFSFLWTSWTILLDKCTIKDY